MGAAAYEQYRRFQPAEAQGKHFLDSRLRGNDREGFCFLSSGFWLLLCSSFILPCAFESRKTKN
jgi:hypothetical protein